MILLLQFLLRLTFGLALGMGLTSPRQVTSGYYRNHLYVTLGLMVLAALICQAGGLVAFWPTLVAAVASYVGSVFWLYEKPRLGILSLFIVAGAALSAIGLSLPMFISGALTTSEISPSEYSSNSEGDANRVAPVVSAEKNRLQVAGGQNSREYSRLGQVLQGLAAISSSLLLGITMAAMLLGHWYLNTPTMEMAPLQKLILMMAIAVFCQGIISAAGLWGNLNLGHTITPQWVYFLLIRWLFGLVGVGILTWMAWQTLKIPNTQSATGILYVAVIGTFVGETMALLLSGGSCFPL